MKTIVPTAKKRKPSSGEDHEEREDEEGRSHDEILFGDQGDDAGEERDHGEVSENRGPEQLRGAAEVLPRGMNMTGHSIDELAGVVDEVGSEILGTDSVPSWGH